MGISIGLEWKRCELDTILDAQWASLWATVHGKQRSFQPVGQWMGYSFTDLGAEGCRRSLNALFVSVEHTFVIVASLIPVAFSWSLVDMSW